MDERSLGRQEAALRFQSARGMRDLLPEETLPFRQVEKLMLQRLQAYGYQEVFLPLLEPAELFIRGIGEGTDIAQKELFLLPGGQELLALRPEGTAGAVRAGIQHGKLRHQVQKWFYSGPLFRRERPQKGRYRQFHQVGVEQFGLRAPEADIELMVLSHRVFRRLGLLPYLKLELNSLGSLSARERYLVDLQRYLRKVFQGAEEGLRERIEKYPLRLLDSSDPSIVSRLGEAPLLRDYLEPECREHFEAVCEGLKRHQIPYLLSPRLVRGLDYYNRTVFEWTTEHLGTQNTLCGGGRYDGLAERLGGEATPAVGMAWGIERVLLLLKEKAVEFKPDSVPAVAVISEDSMRDGPMLSLGVAESLRSSFPDWRILLYPGLSRINQLKFAERDGASVGVMVEDEEQTEAKLPERVHLRCFKTRAMEAVAMGSLMDRLKERCFYE